MFLTTTFSYLISFLLAIALPSYLIPLIVSRFIKNTKYHMLSLYLIIFGFIVCIFWQALVRGNVYSHWDSYTLGYTYLFHEGPESQIVNDGYLSNWNTSSLEILWLVITGLSYLSSGLLFFLTQERSQRIKQFILLSLAGMLLTTFLFIPMVNIIFQ